MVSKYLFRYVFISSICCLIIHPCLTLNATPIFDNLLVLDTNLSSDNADTLVERGNFLFDKKNYSEAIHSYKRALAFSSDNKQQGYILNLIGRSYFRAKDIKNAMEFYERSLQIRRSIKDINGEITSLGNIALVYEIQNNYTKSVEYHLKALSLSKENQELAQQSRALGNLARANYFLGSYAKSLDYYQQALQVRQLLKNTFEQGKSWMGIGLIYHELGEYKRALENYQMALQLFKTSQNKTDDIWTEQGRLLNNIGLTYIRLEKYQEALDYLFQSLALRQKVGDRKGEAKTLTNIGDTYRRIQQYSKSLSMLKKALGIAREIGDMESIAQVLESIATVYQIEQGYVQAFDIYQQALSISKSPYNRASIFSNLGDLFTRWGKVATAIAFYKKSIQITETIRQDLTSLPIEQQKSYAETVAYTYRALADLLLSQGRVLEAQQVLELLKIQEIRDFTKDTRAGGTDELGKLSPRELSVINPIDSLIKLGLEIDKCQSNCSDAFNKDLKDQRMAVTEEFNKTVDLLEKDSKDRLAKDDGFFRPNKIKNKFEDIVRAQPNTVLIYTFVQKDRTWILWASKGAITKSIEIPKIGREQISKLVFELRSQLSKPNTDIKQLKSTSKKIYDILIPQSLQSELDKNNIQNLVFSLDSVTRYVPMSVLFDGNQYLLEKYTISNLISADLINTTDRLPSDKQKINVLAAGVSQKFEGFDPLSNVPIELNAIVKSTQNVNGIFNGKQLLNQEFTRTSLRDNISGSNILHIATHGRFVPVDANASFLLLGNGDKLFIKELKNLIDDLNQVHLVVLSACQTALGGLGDDGVEISGISYYFLNGGAKAVIASLWAVNDDSTRQLMQHFYANLVTNGIQSQITKVKALQKAQLSLLHSDNESESAKTKSGQVVIEERSRSNVQTRSKTNFAHPYYWAPFILIGNGL